MNNFEQIAASPETLGALLASLSIADGPWEEAFHRTFCDGCKVENCDAENCPHNAERDNPLWWLMQEAAGEQERDTGEPSAAERVVFRNGRLELKAVDGKCMEFNVYLGRKKQDGINLNGVEKVVLPTVTKNVNGTIEPMEFKLVFRSWEPAEAVIKVLGKPCIIEIRPAVQHLSKTAEWEFHGNCFILEAMPLEIAPEPLSRGCGTGVEIWFLVSRYAAYDTEDNERWSFEWHGLRVEPENAASQAQEMQERERRVAWLPIVLSAISIAISTNAIVLVLMKLVI